MKKISISVKVIFIYTTLSLLWVIFSDKIIYTMTDSAYSLSRLQTYKGYLFVMLSSSLLFLILKNVETRFKNMISNLRMKNLALYQDNEVLRIQLESKESKLNDLGYYGTLDESTGLLNRRKGLELLKQQLDIAKDTRSNLLVAFIDIDGLQTINDKYGRYEGDILIATAARILNNTIGKNDIIFRIGGDEFLIVFPEAAAKDINTIKNKLDTALYTYNLHSNKTYAVGFSIGFSEYNYEEDMQMKELIDKADLMMFEEKRGRKFNSMILTS